MALSCLLLLKQLIAFLKRRQEKRSVRLFLWMGGVHLLLLPFVYLAMHHSIAITEEEILVSPFWDTDQKRYSWKAVDFLELGYEYDEGAYYGYYELYLADGQNWDLWSDEPFKLMFIDHLAAAKQIEKEYWSRPHVSELSSWANNSNYSEAELSTLFEVGRE
ncbi:hypothetical protein [Bacillus xiapuensis]|uniref:hypothetical protein n=1 Tax=Bacillus xiapuensis TaxID=2014075 RepID=UPI0012FD956C|nr:hypothetical protein [Bacillus xiapuensis]